MSEPYVTVATGRDLLGVPWEVGVRGPGVVIGVHGSGPLNQLCLDGEPLARFAEAVARAQSHAEAHHG